jgi:hypothetical protein
VLDHFQVVASQVLSKGQVKFGGCYQWVLDVA